MKKGILRSNFEFDVENWHLTFKYYKNHVFRREYIFFFEPDLHVVVYTVPALPGAQVPWAGGGDEVVALASLKLHRVGLGGERAE